MLSSCWTDTVADRLTANNVVVWRLFVVLACLLLLGPLRLTVPVPTLCRSTGPLFRAKAQELFWVLQRHLQLFGSSEVRTFVLTSHSHTPTKKITVASHVQDFAIRKQLGDNGPVVHRVDEDPQYFRYTSRLGNRPQILLYCRGLSTDFVSSSPVLGTHNSNHHIFFL